MPISGDHRNQQPGHMAQRPAGTRFRTDSAGAARAAQGRRTAARPAAARPVTGRQQAVHAAPTGGVQSAYARTARPRKKTPIIVPILVGVIVIAIIGVIVGFVVPNLVTGALSHEEEVTVEPGIEVQITIPDGASGDQIASILSENGIIPDPQEYYAAVRAMQADTSLKPGDYLLETLMDPEDVVRQLIEGPNVAGITFTIPEGLTVSQTAARVEEAFGIPADEFIAQAKASAYVDDYAFLSEAADDSLEGFLYPKTYALGDAPTADDVIRAMLDQYQTEVASLDFDSARAAIRDTYGVEMSDYDFLILASIVEREGLDDEQRQNVASTFYNRLEIDMPLQSDATMMYETGGEVTADDLKVESPYNTYLSTGLTPTPICAPSINSIQATLNPPNTDYLYFFITTEEEYFSATYDDHLQAIEENR